MKNAFRWDCDVKGCFNKVHRPRFEELNDLLPGKIAFSDVDGIVEINGRALMLEWKGLGVPTPMGQHIMFRRLTMGGNITVFVIEGAAHDMTVESLTVYENGTIVGEEVSGGRKNADLDTLKKWISFWTDWARGPSYHG
jgi:hypothetical protein